jgi:hypothetical protein
MSHLPIEDQAGDVKTVARLLYLKVYDIVFRPGHTTKDDLDQALYLAGHATNLADELFASATAG